MLNFHTSLNNDCPLVVFTNKVVRLLEFMARRQTLLVFTRLDFVFNSILMFLNYSQEIILPWEKYLRRL